MDERDTFDARLGGYYIETDIGKRREILNGLMASDPERTAKLKELWSLRYRETKQGTADGFIGAFMELYYVSREIGSIFMGKHNMKAIKNALKSLGLSEGQSFPEEMLYKEHKHLALCYIEVTQKNGGPRLLGFAMSSKPDYIDEKLRSHFFKAADELPEKAGLQKEFAPLSRALRDAAEEYLKN